MPALSRPLLLLALAAGLLARPALAQGWDEMRVGAPAQTALGDAGAEAAHGYGTSGHADRRLDEADRVSMDRSERQAVAQNRQVAWRNPATGNSGAVVPLRTYRSGVGRTCREYERTLVVDGRAEPDYVTACRNAVGEWEVRP